MLIFAYSSNIEVSYSFRIRFQGLLNFSPFIPAWLYHDI